MICNHVTRVLIYTPFKNYSSSLHGYFGPRARWHSLIGLNPDFNFNMMRIHCNRHTALVPDHIIANYKKFLPIRNPYDRVKSQWFWHRKTCDPSITFDDWFTDHSRQPVCLPVSVVYPNFDEIIHVESIVEDLRKFDLMMKGGDGVELTFPHLNPTPPEDEEFEFTDAQRVAIQYLHHEDFKTGGYLR